MSWAKADSRVTAVNWRQTRSEWTFNFAALRAHRTSNRIRLVSECDRQSAATKKSKLTEEWKRRNRNFSSPPRMPSSSPHTPLLRADHERAHSLTSLRNMNFATKLKFRSCSNTSTTGDLESVSRDVRCERGDEEQDGLGSFER